jgi:signal transduction histidine kinase
VKRRAPEFLSQAEFWLVLGAAATLTASHYLTHVHDPFWHDLFRRLYYLPIILAGFRYGLRGGLLTALGVALAFIPHVLMTRQALPRQASEAVFEIPLYLAVGVITGILSDRQRRLAESLRRTERLKTLGELAAGVAHEVKNPLAAIRSSAELLGKRCDERGSRLAELVVGEADRLNRLVNDFLAYARPSPLHRVLDELGRIVRSSAELVATAAAARSVAVSVDGQPSPEPQVRVDPDALRQVFVNLLLNAVQASPPGGTVRVNVAWDTRTVSALIADTGPGIPPENLRRVYEPFFSTREGGTGLGLSIAQRIVAEHGGRLTLENNPAGGAVALVSLPRSRS